MFSALARIGLATPITQADFMRALLGTVRLTPEEWFVGFCPAACRLWEAGKAVAARVRAEARPPTSRFTRDAGNVACGRLTAPNRIQDTVSWKSANKDSKANKANKGDKASRAKGDKASVAEAEASSAGRKKMKRQDYERRWLCSRASSWRCQSG